MTAGAASLKMRPAVLTDLSALTAVDAQCFPPGIAYPPREIAALLNAANARTLIAERSQAITGFVAARFLRRRLPHPHLYGELITIDVLPEFRREHIGWRLYNAIENWLRVRNAVRVELHVAVDNAPAMQFYERLGYVAVGRMAGYYMGALDAWKMEKMLTEVRDG